MKFFKEIQQPDAYQRDEINAKSGFGKDSYAYQQDGGANDEDHEGDARREQQVQSGTWYIRLNGKLVKDKAGKPYSYSGKAAANKAALTMQAKLFNQGKEFMLTTNPNDKVAEASPTTSMYYSEELAQKVFDLNPNLDASGKADAVLDAGWPIAVKDLGAKSANSKFAYDEDFPSDFVSMYAQLQKQGVAEGFNGEYDDEAGMAKSNLRTMARAVHGLIDTIGDDENLPEWAQEKIAKAEMMVTGVRDYLLSQEEQGIDPKVDEASLASMRDYFSQADTNTVAVDNEYGAPERKQPANVPPEIQMLINKMYSVGKITPQEFDVLKRFQAKTGMNVGIKEADMTTGNQGYDSMLAVMKAVDAGHDATFNLGGEPITLDYNEARFLSGKYKAFLKAGRQEEFLKYMENPMAFDRLMKQLRDLMDKQKNFRGSVQGERGIEESHDDSPVAAALTRKIMSQRLDLLKKYGPVKVTQAIDSAADFFGDVEEIGSSDMYAYMQYVEKELGSMDNNLPAVNENEYWCQLDRTAKLIPEGYKKLSSGYITRT